jgi:hypothetical protein
LIAWEEITSRLTSARNYWIATASMHGYPQATPVWGLWYEDAFYFGTDPTSRKGKNIAAHPHVILHLESGDDVVIVEGTSERLLEGELGPGLDELYFQKYGYRLSGNPTYHMQPSKVMAWSEADFPESATRWRFTGPNNPVER